nr:uncharacterized protein LOC123747203 [Procambarus clarkii]
MTSKSFASLLVFTMLLMLMMVPLARARIFGMEDMTEDSQEETRSVSLSSRDHTNCCIRQAKMKNIGVSDATGEEILIDVGHCRKHCSRKQQLKRVEFERLLLENPEMDPRLLFLLNSGQQRGSPSCPEEEACTASESRVERLATTEGVVSVTVTEACQCQPRPHSCRRQPRPVTLHKGTPLQTTIDLGDCQGHCFHELGCKAIKSRTVSVEGPNGSECVSVVEECGCESSCYRAALYQHLYNYTTPDEPTIQVIDVGTCIGECDTMPEDHCVFRESSGGCMMSLVKRSSRCSPTGINNINITQADGSKRTLTTVTHCGCH